MYSKYLLLMSLFCSFFVMAHDESAIRLQQSFIWNSVKPTDKQQYVVFRKSFDFDKNNDNIDLEIFTDSRYLLWINGKYVMRGPCRFHPSRPEYDKANISKYLSKGKNVIAVLVHNYGNDINGRMMKGEPVFTLRLVDSSNGKEWLKTDDTWKCSDNVSYQPASASWNTVIDNIDGRIDISEWKDANFDDSLWKYSVRVQSTNLGKLERNMLPLPIEKEITNLVHKPSNKPLNMAIPITLKQGDEVVIDYGKMALVYTDVRLEATQNSVLSLQFALRYKNGKPFEKFGGGNKYTARNGMQQFITSDQWGSHYMILKCDTGNITLHNVRVIERSFPYERSGSFECSDTLLNDLWTMAVNTIQATVDDAYGSDARERNEWIQDGAKASFPCAQVALSASNNPGKTEMGLLRNIIRHAALSQLADGRFRATYPTDRGDSDCHYFIDDYACQWFEALNTYLDKTGDIDFAKQMFPHLKAQISWFEKQRQPNGLYLLREYTSFDNPFAYITCQGATINAFLYQALSYATLIAEKISQTNEAQHFRSLKNELYKAYNNMLWNNDVKAYSSAVWNGKLFAPTVHAQLIALQSGIVPQDRIEHSRRWFLQYYNNPGMVHCCTNNDTEQMILNKTGIKMPIEFYWVFKILYQTDTSVTDEEALNQMRKRWFYMVNLQKDAGTLSESFVNADGGGSHESCHNYGAVPAYYLSSYVLGVRSEKPLDAKEIIIEPRLGDLSFAKGSVVTEHGTVSVDWTRKKGSVHFDISVPKGVTAVLRLPASSTKDVSISEGLGKKSSLKKEGRWIEINDIKDKCSGNYLIQIN